MGVRMTQGVPTQIGPIERPAVCEVTPPRPWDDAPMRAKVTLLILGGIAIGVAVGHLADELPLWLVVAILLASLSVGSVAAYHWFAHPLDRFARQLEIMARANRPSGLHELPVCRRDELGRIARAVQLISATAIKQHHEAKQLRQSLDARIALETNNAVRQLRQLAMRDPLTELGNRRFLDEHFEQLTKVSLASHTDLVCVLIDVDKFKEVNDSLGHAAGDELLVFIASLIRASVRHDDLAVRLGGDEFVVLMPGAAMHRVEAFTESLRKLLCQQAKLMYPNGPHPNLSIGIASLLGDRCDSSQRLLEVADGRLYEAKRRGRACTIGVEDAPVNPNLPIAG